MNTDNKFIPSDDEWLYYIEKIFGDHWRTSMSVNGETTIFGYLNDDKYICSFPLDSNEFNVIGLNKAHSPVVKIREMFAKEGIVCVAQYNALTLSENTEYTFRLYRR